MKKISVIFTGGTIGSRYTSANIDVEEQSAYILLERYKQQHGDGVEFLAYEALQQLSENLLPAYWNIFFNAILTVAQNGCDGIILTHGTDTLHMTAAALGLMLGNFLPIPVILVSADYPLENPMSNGYINFCIAVDMIVQERLQGVFAVYAQEGERYVHLATRLCESVAFIDNFYSAGGLWWGKMQDGMLSINDRKGNVSLEEIRSKAFQLRSVVFSDKVLYIKPYTGLNYNLFDFTRNKPQAVLHGAYHSGTANASEQSPYSAAAFVKRCKEQRIPVYLAPVNRREGDRYASTDAILQAGAIPLEHITQEAALVKVMLAYGSIADENERSAYLQSDIFFEQVLL